MKLMLLICLLLSACGVEKAQDVTPITPGEPIPHMPVEPGDPFPDTPQPNEPEPDEPSPEPLPEPNRVKLKIWGAYWCGYCSRDIPRIGKLLDNLGIRERVDIEVWVPTGMTSGSLPTQDIANSYLKKLGVGGSAVIDPKWLEFRSYFGSTLSIPAGVIHREDGSIVSLYHGHAAPFNPGEIVNRIKMELK